MADKDFVVKNGLVVNNSFYANATGIYIGNSISNSFINSTSFSGTTNTATYLGDAANFGNSSGIFSTAKVNSATISVGTSFVANTSNVTAFGFYVNSTSAYAASLNATSITTSNVTINASGVVVANATANVFVANSTGVTSSLGLSANTLTVTGFANLAGNANVGGDVSISGNLQVSGTLTYTGTGTGSIVPASNDAYALGSFSNVWTGIYGNAGVFITTVRVGNSSVNVSINSTSFSGSANSANVANSATYFGGQLAAYYLNYNNMSAGSVAPANLPQANTTANGAVILLDSVSNTSVSIYAPTANAVKTAYDAAIAANTRASSAQTAAVSAYNNATSFASNAQNITTGTIFPSRLPQANDSSNGAVIFLDSTSNSAIAIYAPTMNAVAQTYSAAIAANTRATSAQSAAISAYTNATTFSANANNITTGTLGYARLGPNVINTTSNFTISGIYTYSANVVIQAGLSANGSYGTANQVLTTNGTAAYWANASGGGAVGNTSTGDQVFYVGGQTVNGSFTTNATLNYMSAGPITVNPPAVVTITTGSRWAIV